MTNGTESPRTSLHVFPDLEALSRAAAQHIVSHIDRVLSEQKRYTLALAGGSTPQRLYELLADVYSGTLPWNRVHLFWGDERCVPHDHPQSNYRLAGQTLLDPIDIPPENVHPIPAEGKPAERARDYAETLAEFFDAPTRTFDAALLGMGADGHTASVFPPVETDPSDGDASDAPWVRVTEAPDAEISTRITCTLPVLSGASQALFLVSGSHKREALSHVLDDEDPSLPAARVSPRTQRSWFVDTAARPQTGAGA
jgi:6-phosphogluconolactonase